MLAYERSLVDRLSDRRFAMIGVNADPTLEQAKVRNEQRQVNWRNFWIGKEGPRGPLAKAWNVYAWPTLYVIDHKGVIRHRWIGHPGDEVLSEAIDKLVVDAEASETR